MKKMFLILYLLIAHCAYGQSHHWVQHNKDAFFSYIFAPGMLVSEAHLGNYCPSFVASTGELVTGRGICVIKEPVSANNFAEIELQRLEAPFIHDSFRNNLDRIKNSPLILIGYLGSALANHHYGIKVTNTPENAHHSLRRHWVNPKNINVAQEEDLSIFKGNYDQHMKAQHELSLESDHHCILYGVSRGAATIFNFVAQEKPESVKAVICEGLFDSLEHIAQNKPNVCLRAKLKFLAVTKFKFGGVSPISMVDQFPHDVPLLLVTSLRDNTVPFTSPYTIYSKLRKSGHKKVHLLVLEHAPHPKYTCGTPEDTELYQAVVHAFYKEYGLPYIAGFAHLGQYYFNHKSQPVC